MKHLVLITLVSLSTISYSQEQYLLTGSEYIGQYSSKEESERNKKVRISNKIKSEKVFKINRKGDRMLSSEIIYDKKGNWSEKSYFNKKGNKTRNWEATWNDLEKIESTKGYKSGKLKYTTEWKYNLDGQLEDYKHLKKGDKIAYGASYVYNGDLLMEITYITGDKLYMKYVYSYYKDGQPKETISYKKGKEKYRWSYKCDPEGKEMSKKEMEVCEKSEVDDKGIKTVVYTYNNEKRKVRKAVLKFDANGNKLSHTQYDKNDKTKSRTTSTYDERNNRTSWTYYPYGRKKASGDFRYEYDENNNKVKETILKKDLSVRSTYFYDHQSY